MKELRELRKELDAAIKPGHGQVVDRLFDLLERQIKRCERLEKENQRLAERIAETLVRWLPESSARASRAPDQRRIASLLASSQWQVSVLNRAEAADLAAGRGLFDTIGSLALRSLFAMGDHLLVSRVDFPFRHAWLVAATLTENAAAIPGGCRPSMRWSRACRCGSRRIPTRSCPPSARDQRRPSTTTTTRAG